MLNKQQNIINKIKNKTKQNQTKQKKKGPTNSFTSLKHAHGENLFYIFKIVHLKLVTLQVQWWTLRLSIILHNLTSSIWVCFFFFLNSAKYFIQECTWMGVLQTKKYITKVTANRKKTKTNEKKKYKLYKEIAIDNKISPPWEANLSPTQSLDFCGFFCLSRCCYNQYID